MPFDTDGDEESELIVTYTLGYKGWPSQVLQLTGVNVGNGQWHNISVVRERTQVTLSVDTDGDGYSVTGVVVTHSLLLIVLGLEVSFRADYRLLSCFSEYISDS